LLTLLLFSNFLNSVGTLLLFSSAYSHEALQMTQSLYAQNTEMFVFLCIFCMVLMGFHGIVVLSLTKAIMYTFSNPCPIVISDFQKLFRSKSMFLMLGFTL